MDLKQVFENEQSLKKINNILLFALIFVLMLSAVAFSRVNKASDGILEAAENRGKSEQLANELETSSDELTRMARSYAETGNKEYLRQYDQVLAIRNGRTAKPKNYNHSYWQLVDINNPQPPKEFGETIALKEEFKRAGFSQKEFELLKKAENFSLQLAETERLAFALLQNDKEGTGERATRLLFDNNYAKAKRTIKQPIIEFRHEMEKRLERQSVEAVSAYTRARVFFFIMIVLAITLIALVFFANRKLGILVVKRSKASQAQAEQENEQLNNSIINILQSVAQLSQKDLTVRVPVTSDVVGTVSDSINFLAEETGRVMQEVKTVAGLVKDSSTKVKSQAEHVTQTADEERQNIEEMSEELVKATQTMQQVAQLAAVTNEAGNQVTQVTESALDTVTDTVVGMESIRSTIAESEKRIKRLGERSQEISSIVNLINTISERTHVLALNASMQAAVAGEAGRGFAVVAEEVQRLAESSQNATKQIESLVHNIQIDTNETINTVNNTISQVVEGSEHAQKAGEQMRETQKITAKLVEQVQYIANASDMQREMSEQLLRAVNRIGDSTNKTASQIELQNAETDNLQVASDRLVEVVSIFKLPE